MIIKTIFLMAATLSAALVSAEPPAVVELPEIPAQYCGTFYLHEKQAKPGQTELVAPAQAFGKIAAQQVWLSGPNPLKVASVQRTVFPGRDGKPVPSIVVRFAQTNLMWGVAAMPDSSLGIMQLVFDVQNNVLGEFVWLGVSRNQAAIPHPVAPDNSVIRLAADPQPQLRTPPDGAGSPGGGRPAFAELPVVTQLQEIPAQYCGTYYLHGKASPDAGMEQFSAAQPFGKIAAKQITLADGKLLKVTSIQQTVLPKRDGAAQKTLINIQFEQADFTWGIGEMPDSKLAIVQTGFSADPQKMQGTMFVVSQKQ